MSDLNEELESNGYETERCCTENGEDSIDCAKASCSWSEGECKIAKSDDWNCNLDSDEIHFRFVDDWGSDSGGYKTDDDE